MERHYICATPKGVPCRCVGRKNAWDECVCDAADRRRMRTRCRSCRTTMIAIDFETGEPIKRAS